MRTHTKILLAFLLLPALALAGCAGNRAAAPPGRPGAPTALALLQQSDPKASWEAASQVRADLDLDGVADYALRGLRKDRVVVGIVKGPLAADSRTWVLAFPWGKKTEGSLCSKKVKIELEDLDDSATAGAKPAGTTRRKGKGKGISLYDDRCDAFHIYWDADGQKFDWWRL
jgi:hypothetical protein